MPLTFSAPAQALTSSAIREILKVTERPEVISFAGGLPAPETFPIPAFQRACERVISCGGSAAFQYSPTEGYGPLRAWIAERHGVFAEDVLITTGSQQALDLLAKVLIDPGSPVLLEAPSYLGALQAFSLQGPRFIALDSDEDGLIPQALSEELCTQARFLYVLPNFQNPTGRTLSLARRQAIVQRAQEQDLWLIEDDPYAQLSYQNTPLPSLRSLAPERVAYLGSFSKTLAPGLRIGYIIAPQILLKKLIQTKQASDLHTPSFTQRIAYEVLAEGNFDQHIEQIRKRYAARCQRMLAALEREMPEQVRWSRPTGGMFLWLTLPEQIDTQVLLQTCIAQNVAFVPGAPFFAGKKQNNTLRLAFVSVDDERIDRGIKILAQSVRCALAQ